MPGGGTLSGGGRESVAQPGGWVSGPGRERERSGGARWRPAGSSGGEFGLSAASSREALGELNGEDGQGGRGQGADAGPSRQTWPLLGSAVGAELLQWVRTEWPAGKEGPLPSYSEQSGTVGVVAWVGQSQRRLKGWAGEQAP